LKRRLRFWLMRRSRRVAVPPTPASFNAEFHVIGRKSTESSCAAPRNTMSVYFESGKAEQREVWRPNPKYGLEGAEDPMKTDIATLDDSAKKPGTKAFLSAANKAERAMVVTHVRA